MGGNRGHQITVSERTSMDDLRKIVSTYFEGRCRVQPDQFPLCDGTRVLVTPSFLPLNSLESTMNFVVPYVVHNGHKRPLEIAPDTPIDMLEHIAALYRNQPTKIRVPRLPIHTGDEIIMIMQTDVQMAQEIKLQELREADKLLPPTVQPRAPPTMPQVLRQAPPRAQSRDIIPPWEMSKPTLKDFANQGDRIPVILHIEESIQGPSKKKVYLREHRDETWEKDTEQGFGFPVDIHPDVVVVTENLVVLYKVRFNPDYETPTATKGVFYVTPRVPLSFPIGIAAVFNEEITQITVPNNIPAVPI
jgi:hypothetical protein